MKRIVVSTTAALVTALMMAAMAMPAFAVVGGGGGHCGTTATTDLQCQGGGGIDSDSLCGGSGVHVTYVCESETVCTSTTQALGSGGTSVDDGTPGGFGSYCADLDTLEPVCHGTP
jgi:hypothetical protein